MAKQKGTNTFNNGLNLDFDLMTVGSDMYILSENGRILYTDQSSLSWVNAKGNTPAITFNPEVAANYIPIGYAVINNLLVLWLVDEGQTLGEIALITFDENGIQNAYQTLMNDDGFTDKFNFVITNQIEAYGVYENDQCIRTYWVDGVEDDSNPPRSFTFKFDGSDINLATDYSAVTLSPHAVDQQADFNMGIIKFDRTISGSIPAGVYEMSYRLVTVDGYATPWYPPTLPLFVTQDSVNPTNWNEYEMEGTETFVSSGKGNRWEILGIDTRYQTIEVAYVHYIANGVPFESNIFTRTTITGTTMTFDHVVNSGTPLDPLEIPAQRIAFDGAKTLDFKDEVQYLGNVNEKLFRLTDDEQEELLENLTIEPKFRLMRSDEKILDKTLGNPVDEAITFPGKPLTHQVPTTGVAAKRLNQSLSLDYTINNDYMNYKGTQVSHQFTGLWRGEPYRLGIQFFDSVGNASFAYHLADVTIDEQYGTDLNWTRLKADGTTVSGSFTYGDFFRLTENGTESEDPVKTGDPYSPLISLNRLRILGLEIGGLNLTSIKSRIKGFMIVRAERDASILGQGLIMPCVREEGYTTPLPIPTQDWIGANASIPMIPADAGSDIYLPNSLQSKAFYHLKKDTGAEEPDRRFKLRPNTSTMYMPDIDFDISRYPTAQPVDRIRLVGVCGQKNFDAADAEPRHRQWMTYNNYVIQKLETTDNTFHATASAPYPQFGDDATISDLRLADYGGTPGGEFPNYSGTTLNFFNSCGQEAGYGANYNFNAFYATGGVVGKSDIYAHGKNRTMFIFHGNFGAAASPIPLDTRSSQQYANFFIANYRRPNASPYGGITPSSLEQTRFISMGHFQPVNNPAIVCPDTVNEIEVFGGDCYLDYFAMVRLYGILLESNFQDNDDYSDYGIGMEFPLESSLHHSLRQATNISGVEDNPMYPDVGLKPAKVFYGDDTATAAVQNGLFLNWDYEGNNYGQTVIADSNVEEFNISGVLGLQAILKIYFGELSQFKDIDKYPIRWRYSEIKIYGEPIDKYRSFLANDYRDLKGQYGPITSSKFIFGQIYSFQEKGFGRLRAFDRGALVDQTLGNLYTGLGSKLDGIDYISTKMGNQHQWSLVSSGKALYWVDAYMKSIMRFAQDGSNSLSDDRNVKVFAESAITGLQFFNQPAQGNGIMTVFDYDNEEALFTFIRTFQEPFSKFTKNIIYNEKTDRFVDTPTFNANFGLSFNHDVYHFNREFPNTMYLHNNGNRGEYFGEVNDAKITVVVNDFASIAKVFDSMRMNINDSVVTMIKEVVMETQNQTETIDMTTDTRWEYLEDILRGPLRTVDQADRMRGKWIKLTFVFDNTPNAKLIFTNLITEMRPSRRF